MHPSVGKRRPRRFTAKTTSSNHTALASGHVEVEAKQTNQPTNQKKVKRGGPVRSVSKVGGAADPGLSLSGGLTEERPRDAAYPAEAHAPRKPPSTTLPHLSWSNLAPRHTLHTSVPPYLRSPSPEPGRRRGSGGQDVKGAVAQRKAHEFAAP